MGRENMGNRLKKGERKMGRENIGNRLNKGKMND